MSRTNVDYPNNGILIQQSKAINYWYTPKHGWFSKALRQIKEPRGKGLYIVRCHFNEIFTKGKVIELESKLAVV